MTISMNLWEIGESNVLKSVPKSKLDLEVQLENWIVDDPTILDLDILVLGRQVHTDYGGYIDILGLNKEGDLVIIELKKDKTPRDIIAQCLDYASWINELGYEQIHDIYKNSTGKMLADSYQKLFDDSLPETLNENHKIVIVASSLDESTERIIRYLADKHSININAVFFDVFKLGDKQILGRSWLKDPELVEEKSTKSKGRPGLGIYSSTPV